MVRSLRVEYPGAFYHIFNRGNSKENIFLTNRDREKFLEYLETSVDRFSLIIHAYCLMDNHYHLIVETPEANLSKALQWLNVSYAVYFNKKKKRSGHLFQGRFKAVLISADEYLKILSRYIHLNPVRAQIVSRPHEYKWSSYNALTGTTESPAWLATDYLLSYFHKTRKNAMQLLRKFCEEVDVNAIDDPMKNAVHGFILGGERFVKKIQERLVSPTDEKEVPQLKKLKLRPTKEQIVDTVRREFSCQRDDILAVGKKRNAAREVAIYLSQLHTGLTGKELGQYFGNISGARISTVMKKVPSEMEADKELKRKIGTIEKKIINN
jgi:putative transposase